MDGSQVSVLEEGDEVGLGGFLEGHDGGGLEAEVGLRGGRQSAFRSMMHEDGLSREGGCRDKSMRHSTRL